MGDPSKPWVSILYLFSWWGDLGIPPFGKPPHSEISSVVPEFWRTREALRTHQWEATCLGSHDPVSPYEKIFMDMSATKNSS